MSRDPTQHCLRPTAGSTASAVGRTAATDAVKPWRKLRSPTGPSSPAQNMPATGAVSDVRATTPASWSGRAEEVRAAAVAGEHERARSPALPGEQRAEVLVGRRRRRAPGTARWCRRSPRRRRRWRRPPDRRRARCGRGSRPGRSRPCARRSPARGGGPPRERAVVGSRLVEQVRSRSSAGPAGELVDDVALALRHHEGLADRPAPLRHDACVAAVPAGEQRADGARR